MKKKVTLHDIAKEAGTHVSTISKALHNSSDINGETRDRIIEIATKLGYKINPQTTKKAEISQPSNRYVIGVVCPEIKSNFYAQLVDAIDQNCREKGFTCSFAFSNFNPSDELHHIGRLMRSSMDGIVFITENRELDHKILTREIKRKIPFINIAPEPILQEYDSIMIDDDLGVTTAVKHLIDLKHTKIGYIGDTLSNERLSVFRKTLKTNGLQVDPDLIVVRNERFEECGYLGVKDLLERDSHPTAMLTAYDDIAVGALRALQEAGLQVPEDMSVIGIDNIQVSPYLHVGLTTVGCPLIELGRIVAEMLVEKIKKPESTLIQHITLKPVLIIRESTGMQSH